MEDTLCDRPGKLSLEEARRNPPNVRRRDKTVKKFVQSKLRADFGKGAVATFIVQTCHKGSKSASRDPTFNAP